MKKFRKGFTLVELLIVIGIMGTLSSLAMIAGQEASDAAKATNIADGLEKVSIAMMSYYADNNETIDVSGAKTEDVVAGANAYLKTKVVAQNELAEGRYAVVLSAESNKSATWWVAYKLAKTDGNVGKVLANKSTRMLLKNRAVAVEGDEEQGIDAAPINPYAGSDTVYMQVR